MNKKYWCPTHPEVESDSPEDICKKCGTMKLIPRVPKEEVALNHPFKDFAPLVVIFVIILSFALIFSYGKGVMHFMRDFMGGFFILFGLLKVLKLKAFAEAYEMYDVLAQKSKAYAHAYPFIELGLGLLFIFNIFPIGVNIFTFVIMLIGAWGVYLKLKKKELIPCACLGTVFKVPMTWVTLMEDLLMAVMSLIMLILLM
ncbi:MAG: hypothetical protein ACI9AR_000206 [Flavobacteriaceae bacterium]|jgi:hypothetical protein